jgi:hypothetical protein
MAVRRKTSRLQVCPVCNKPSLFYNERDRKFECLNHRCRSTGKSFKELEIKARSNRSSRYRQLRVFREAFSNFAFWLKCHLTHKPKVNKRHISSLRNIASKTLVSIALVGVTLIIFTSVSLVITGAVRIAIGVVIGVLGLVLAIWCAKSLSIHSMGWVRFVMLVVLSAIFLILTSSYLGIGTLADSREGFAGALSTTMQ